MDVGLLPLPVEGPIKAMLAATRIDPRRMWRVTCDVLLALFATHLEHEPAPPLHVADLGGWLYGDQPERTSNRRG
jgi:hypothetical protein